MAEALVVASPLKSSHQVPPLVVGAVVVPPLVVAVLVLVVAVLVLVPVPALTMVSSCPACPLPAAWTSQSNWGELRVVGNRHGRVQWAMVLVGVAMAMVAL